VAWHPAASAACVRRVVLHDLGGDARRWRVQSRKGAAVADVGGGHLDLADQAEGVDQRVALAALKPLGAVVAVWPWSVVLTLRLSRIAALGVGGRPCLVHSLYVEAKRL
jgi:hypothetical protein